MTFPVEGSIVYLKLFRIKIEKGFQSPGFHAIISNQLPYSTSVPTGFLHVGGQAATVELHGGPK